MKRKRTSRKKVTKPRAKSVTLNPDIWLRNAKEIAAYRTELLKEQKGVCPISEVELDSGVVDHCHVTGLCRGVLEASTNSLEGMFRSKFNKFKMNERFGVDFSTFLVNMGKYLQQDNKDKPLHFMYMNSKRNKVKRLNKQEIVDKLLKEFNIKESVNRDKSELVRQYTQCFIDKIEKERIMTETEYLLQGENGKRIKESIKQLEEGDIVERGYDEQ